MSYPRTGKITLPPVNAERYTTVCQFCNVGCGYDVYVWPVENAGEPNKHGIIYKIIDEELNRRLENFSPDYTTPFTPVSALQGKPWISESMITKTVRRTWNNGRNTGVFREVFVAMIPSPECPVNLGNHSIRGGRNAEDIWSPWNTPGERRLKNPLVRFGGKLESVSWDYAIELVARVIKGVIDKYGVDRGKGKEGHAIFAHRMDHGGGGGGGMIFNTVTNLFFFYGVMTAFARIHNRPFYGPEVPAAGDAGPGAMNASYHDLRLADVIVLWGANTYSTGTVAFIQHILDNLRGNTKDEKRKWFEQGEPIPDTLMIIIDPRKTESYLSAEAAAGDRVLLLQLNPGTDIILGNAIARVIYERYRDVVNEIINHYKKPGFNFDEQGFNDYLNKALQINVKSLDDFLSEAESITGVSRSLIEKAAEWLAKRKDGGFIKRVFIYYEKGIIWNQNYRSAYTVYNLATLVGALRGVPGTGCQRQGGHQEGYAGVNPPPPPWTDRRGPISKDPNVFDKYQTTKYPEADKFMPVTDFRIVGGEGRVLWVVDQDNYRLAPNAQRLKAAVSDRAWRITRYIFGEAYTKIGGKTSEETFDVSALEPIIFTPPEPREYAEKVLKALDETGGIFVIVQDIYPTFMVSDAHVVLPAAFNNGEWPDVRMNVHERRFRIADAFIDPPGEAKPDWWIYAKIAKKIVELYEAEGRGNDPVALRFKKGFEPIWNAMAQNEADPKFEVENEIFKTYIAKADEFYGNLGVGWEVQYWTTEFKKLDLNILRKLRTVGIQLPITKLEIKGDGTIEIRGIVNIMEPNLNDTYREEVVIVSPDGTITRKIERVPSTDYAKNASVKKLSPWPATWKEYPPYIKDLKNKGYKYWIINGRYNEIWQTGYQDAHRSEILRRYPTNIIQINPDDASKEGLNNGDIVVVYNDHGSTTAVVWVTEVVKPGTTFLIMAHPNIVGANAVTTPSLDPASNNPDYKLTLANIRKIGRLESTILDKISFQDIKFK